MDNGFIKVKDSGFSIVFDLSEKEDHWYISKIFIVLGTHVSTMSGCLGCLLWSEVSMVQVPTSKL